VLSFQKNTVITRQAIAAAYKRIAAQDGAEVSVIRSMLKCEPINPPVIICDWLSANNPLRRKYVSMCKYTNGLKGAGLVV
jgi:hypothetical protein